MKNNYIYEQKLLQKLDFQQHKSLSDVVYDALKEAILDGTFPLGERINENSLSEQISVSRTPIRRALKRLINDGLVEYVQNYGTVVNSVNTSKIKEIFKIRASLEVILHEEVMRNISEDDLRFLHDCCREMENLEAEDLIEELTLTLNIFNNKMNEIAEMNTLTRLLEDLDAYFKNFRNYSFSTKNRRRIAVKEHSIIVNCLESKNSKFLELAVKRHIANSEKAALGTFVNYKNSTLTETDTHTIPNSVLVFSCDDIDCPIQMP